MPKTIKTREVTRDIKTRSPAPPVGRQMKNAALRAKEAAAKQIQELPQSSPNDYAGNTIEEKSKTLAGDAVRTADSRGREAVKKTYQQMRERAAGKSAAGAADMPEPLDPPEGEAPTPDKPKQQKKRRPKQKQAQRGRGRQAAVPEKPAAQADRPNAPKQVKKQKPGRSIGRTQRNVKTTAQSARQGQQAAKSAAKSAKTARQTAQRIQQTTQQVIQNTKRAAEATYKAVKAAIEGTKLLVEAIIAGGWVAVVIILVICLVGLLFALPFGIFFSGEGKMTMPQAIAALSGEYDEQLEQLQYNYVHDRLEMRGASSINWPQVLAVYAVKTNSDDIEADEVVTLDKKKTDKLRKVLNDMNALTYSVTNELTTRTVVYEDADGQEQERTETIILRTLTIELIQKSAAEMAEAYRFNDKQRALLDELLDPQYAAMWAMLLGGYTPGSGEILQGDEAWAATDIFAWPMQPGYRISSKYGYRPDPFTGEIKFHGGLDIANDEGVAILAAADGIVTVANATDRWGGGYGLHVKIRHEGGYETLYAHCSRIAVTENQEVYQGQVIAFVGSTGNSTGPHLHFEVRKDGARLNPFTYFTIA